MLNIAVLLLVLDSRLVFDPVSVESKPVQTFNEIWNNKIIIPMLESKMDHNRIPKSQDRVQERNKR